MGPVAGDGSRLRHGMDPLGRMDPLTLGPCCSSSSRTSTMRPVTACAMNAFPVQTPETSSVTRVRSIQSFCAQPVAKTSAAARNAQMAHIGAAQDLVNDVGSLPDGIYVVVPV